MWSNSPKSWSSTGEVCDDRGLRQSIRSESPGGTPGRRWSTAGRPMLFFFSSRRRHTRFDCDWSSDVCSSDLDPSEVKTMNCEKHQNLLSDLIDGSLTPRDCDEIEAHLQACPSCADTRTDLHAIVEFCREHRGEYDAVPSERAMWLRISNTIEAELAAGKSKTLPAGAGWWFRLTNRNWQLSFPQFATSIAATVVVAVLATVIGMRARMPITVASTATTTVAAIEVANCGNESCQLRFVKRNHQPAPAGRAFDFPAANSASIVLLMRSHIARSLGTASYSPRCSRQKSTIACRSVRVSAQLGHACRCASISSQSRGVSDPSIRSLSRFWYFSQFIVLTSDGSHLGIKPRTTRLSRCLKQ